MHTSRGTVSVSKKKEEEVLHYASGPYKFASVTLKIMIVDSIIEECYAT